MDLVFLGYLSHSKHCFGALISFVTDSMLHLLIVIAQFSILSVIFFFLKFGM